MYSAKLIVLSMARHYLTAFHATWKFLNWNDTGLKLHAVRLLNKCSKICVNIKVSSYQQFWQLLLLIIDRTWKALKNYWTRSHAQLSYLLGGGGVGWGTLTLIRAGVLGPFSFLFNGQFLAILETSAQFVTSYPWASLPFFFKSLPFYEFENFCSCCCCCNENPCYFCAFWEICGLLEGLFTFRLWYSCYYNIC